MKVLIRADASALIGSGHVMRCLALAAALKRLGAQITFACHALPCTLHSLVTDQGHTVLPLYFAPPVASGLAPGNLQPTLSQRDSTALATALPSGATFDWILVDHYGLDGQWETAARAWARHVAAIDDLANRTHAVDLLLDQNLTASEQRYAPWQAEPCRYLLGPHYALLRDEFQVAARAVSPQVENVLVNFGGMDNAGHTLKAAQALLGFAGLQVTLVAGIGNPDFDALQRLVVERPGWQLLAHSSAFGQLMAVADLFIGAAGSSSWERAALGLPTLCVAVADNQQANAEALAAAGMHCYLGPSAAVSVKMLAAAVSELLPRFDLRQQYAERSRQLVDGFGAQRVAQALQLQGMGA